MLTILAVLVVAVVVVVASVVGGREEVRPTATRVVPPVTAAPAQQSNRMEFVSNDGDGVLIITSRQWSTTGARRPTSGSYLHVEVELICSTGQIMYGPDNFSAFDATGELFEVTGDGRWGTPLGYGTHLGR